LAFSWVGLAITSASFLALIVTMPPVDEIDLPAPIGIPFFIGVGFLGAGLVPAFGAALRDAIRRRDRGLLVGLLIVGALIVLRIVASS
jgi:hypothetical protein